MPAPDVPDHSPWPNPGVSFPRATPFLYGSGLLFWSWPVPSPCFHSWGSSTPLPRRGCVCCGADPSTCPTCTVASNPQLYHHQIMRHRQAQAAQQALLQSQQNGGGPVGMPHGAAAGGMAGPNAVINASRLAAMQNQAGLRTVNLPDHMQQQQLAAQAAAAAAQQQQQQQQHHQQQQYQMQHQHLLAQQAAVQQANAAAAAQGRAHGQPGPLGAQQQMQMMQSPQAIAAAQQQAHVQAQQQAQAHAQAQVQAQAHAAAHQSHPGASAMMQPRAANPLKGRFLLQMMQFADHLSNFAVSLRPFSSVSVRARRRERPGLELTQVRPQDLSWGNDLAYWQKFVDQFFSQSGILRQQLLCQADSSSKQYEISTSALPRYYCTHFESGVRKIQMILENAREREVPNHCHYVESPKASFIYWFESGSQVRLPRKRLRRGFAPAPSDSPPPLCSSSRPAPSVHSSTTTRRSTCSSSSPRTTASICPDTGSRPSSRRIARPRTSRPSRTRRPRRERPDSSSRRRRRRRRSRPSCRSCRNRTSIRTA